MLGLMLEAMRAGMAGFDERIHQARPHTGQVASGSVRAAIKAKIGSFV